MKRISCNLVTDKQKSFQFKMSLNLCRLPVSLYYRSLQKYEKVCLLNLFCLARDIACETSCMFLWSVKALTRVFKLPFSTCHFTVVFFSSLKCCPDPFNLLKAHHYNPIRLHCQGRLTYIVDVNVCLRWQHIIHM